MMLQPLNESYEPNLDKPKITCAVKGLKSDAHAKSYVQADVEIPATAFISSFSG